MDEVHSETAPVVCPFCHIQVRQTDYFCFNCGKNLHPKPLSTSVVTQIGYYLGSVLLPPIGIIWAVRYLREKSIRAKMIGIVCLVLTVSILILAVSVTVAFINTVNDQVNTQMQNLMQF